jgi:hypothetical protein
MTVESRQGKGRKLSLRVAIVDGLHADGFSAQTLADKDLCAFQEEGSIRINPPGFYIAVVFRFGMRSG